MALFKYFPKKTSTTTATAPATTVNAVEDEDDEIEIERAVCHLYKCYFYQPEPEIVCYNFKLIKI